MPRQSEQFRQTQTRLLFWLAVIAVVGMLFSGNVLAQQEDVVARGHLLFSWHCASCHGDTGKGNGVMARVMTIVPADLTQLRNKAGGEFLFWDVYKAIDGREKVAGHGAREMPVWGTALRRTGDLTEDEIRGQILSLVHYLQSIQE